MKAWHITTGGIVTEIEVQDSPGILGRVSREYFGDATLDLTKVVWQGRVRHMAVDDEGMLKSLPINRRATEAYWAASKPGTIHYLCGDAVIFERLLD